MKAIRHGPITGGTVLGDVGQADYNFLFGLFSSDTERHSGRFRSRSVDPAGFPQFLWDEVLVQSIVLDAVSGQPLGLISVYGANFRHSYAYLGIWGIAVEHRSGRLFLALRAFVDDVFANFPLRKLYAEVLAPNYNQFSGLAGSFLTEEGVLRGHEFMDSHYVDLYLLAIYRDQWEESRSSLEKWKERVRLAARAPAVSSQ